MCQPAFALSDNEQRKNRNNDKTQKHPNVD